MNLSISSQDFLVKLLITRNLNTHAQIAQIDTDWELEHISSRLNLADYNNKLICTDLGS